MRACAFWRSLGDVGPDEQHPHSCQLRSLWVVMANRYVTEATRFIAEKGMDWLLALRKEPHAVAHAQLMTLLGVGPKVRIPHAQLSPTDGH